MRPPPQPLAAERLQAAYRRGWFPMADPLTGAIEWFNPDPRAIFPLDRFHVPESLARVVRRGRFDIRCDTSFEQIVRSCAAPRDTDDLTWIDERIVSAYVSLHEAGHAHCVEAWREDRLVAGLYGVHIGAAFMGESMFRLDERISIDASKVCLVHLVRWLQHRGFLLLDTQFYTDHLGQFGCVEIPRTQYLERLAEATGRDVPWGEFSATDEDS